MKQLRNNWRIFFSQHCTLGQGKVIGWPVLDVAIEAAVVKDEAEEKSNKKEKINFSILLLYG